MSHQYISNVEEKKRREKFGRNITQSFPIYCDLVCQDAIH